MTEVLGKVSVWTVIHLDVGEGDVRGARGPHARALHLHALHAGHALLDKDHRQTILAWPACAHRHREVVGEHPVGDPLLLAVDDEELAGRVPVGAAPQARDVAARVRLGDAQADDLLTLRDTIHPATLDFETLTNV